MSRASHYLAIDLGAESGRGMLGTLEGGVLKLEEVHRFPNQPVRLLDTLYWDLPRLFLEVKESVKRAASAAGGRLRAVGVDSWGVDYGLLGPRGDLLGNPIHYRDSRTEGVMEEVFSKLPRGELFQRTGLQFLKLNTLMQLYAHGRQDPDALARAGRMLLIADLIGYFLSGRAVAEYTLASTTQLLDVRTRRWSLPVLEALGIPPHLLPEIVAPGTVLGRLREDIARECGLAEPPLVVAPACHDTAAAVAAVPADEKPGWAYVSSGTWSLVGIELAEPRVTPEALASNFTNEGGAGGKIRFLRNLMGLWLIQESRRQWVRDGREYDYEMLTDMASESAPLASLVHTDDPLFFPPGDMPARVREYCVRTGQSAPASDGALVRCALESIALSYRLSVDRIEAVTGLDIDRVHIVGGGSQNHLLNQFAASALGRPVVAGPAEATACGNILLQALALKEIPSLAALRTVVSRSFETEEFEPGDGELWEAAYQKFRGLAGVGMV